MTFALAFDLNQNDIMALRRSCVELVAAELVACGLSSTLLNGGLHIY